MKKTLRVGVAGLGSVGAATVNLIGSLSGNIELRTGTQIMVTGVTARDKNKQRGLSLNEIEWFDDPLEMARNEKIDVVVEVIGGAEGIAKQLVETAIKEKKHVVTANKALVALYGKELAELAECFEVSLAYEAAVAGGIPIIKSLRESFSTTNIQTVCGILNGTCNYILSNMGLTGKEFDEVLQEAQALGYAETDPSFDVDGIDTAHKLTILSSIAYGINPNFQKVYVEGIRHISPHDFVFAEELGFRIKLLGITKSSEQGVLQRVHPCMIPIENPIAHIGGVFNAVVVDSEQFGRSVSEGEGAGSGPTSSAILADLTDLAFNHTRPVFGMLSGELSTPIYQEMSDRTGYFYLRFGVIDQPGVFADLANVFKENSVSMERIIQRGHIPNEPVQVVLTTHEASEEAVTDVIEQIDTLDTIVQPTRMIRIEPNLFMS